MLYLHAIMDFIISYKVPYTVKVVFWISSLHTAIHLMLKLIKWQHTTVTILLLLVQYHSSVLMLNLPINLTIAEPAHTFDVNQ